MTVTPSFSFDLLEFFRRRQKKKRTSAISAIPTTPPTTPPAMAPVFEELPPEEEVEVAPPFEPLEVPVAVVIEFVAVDSGALSARAEVTSKVFSMVIFS